MPVVIETDREFDLRNGKKLMVGNHWLYPTGARLDKSGAFRMEPPEDEYERLKMRRKYHAEKVRLATTDFQRLRAAMLGEGPFYTWNERLWGNPGTNDGVEALKVMRAIVLSARTDLEQVEAEIEATPQRQSQRFHEEHERQALKAMDDANRQVVARAREVTLDRPPADARASKTVETDNNPSKEDEGGKDVSVEPGASAPSERTDEPQAGAESVRAVGTAGQGTGGRKAAQPVRPVREQSTR